MDERIFEPAFLGGLERDFRLSDYELSVQDGQFTLSFRGLWTETTMWEIYALSAISELQTRASLKRLSEFEWIFSMPGPKPSCGKDGAVCAASRA